MTLSLFFLRKTGRNPLTPLHTWTCAHVVCILSLYYGGLSSPRKGQLLSAIRSCLHVAALSIPHSSLDSYHLPFTAKFLGEGLSLLYFLLSHSLLHLAHHCTEPLLSVTIRLHFSDVSADLICQCQCIHMIGPSPENMQLRSSPSHLSSCLGRPVPGFPLILSHVDCLGFDLHLFLPTLICMEGN